MVENLTHNQNGLVKENDQLHKKVEALKAGVSVPDIYGKMLAIKAELGYVAKDQKNAGQGWKFRGIDQFLNAVKPLLDKHGVGMLPEVGQHSEPKFITNPKTEKVSKQTQIVMKYTFFAGDGSTLAVSIPAEGVDPGDKGTNKALSAALKYCLIQTFSVPTEDMAEGDKENVTVSGSSDAPKKRRTTKTPKASEEEEEKVYFPSPHPSPSRRERGQE